MERAIIISELLKTYQDDKPVLNNFNLEVPAASIFGLIGPNGAGKSTVIGILTGLLDYDVGFIEICGLTFSASNEIKIKKQIASVLQPPLLFENFTSYEFLVYICEMYEKDKADLNDRITSLLEYFEIVEFTHVKVNRLSSGSRKKLAFCAAVLTEPNILFLDEPFESVDVISIGRMKTILRKLRDKGITVFITSHILEVVENLCDDIAILHQGKIIAYLDTKTRMELQKDASLSEIFEKYVKSDTRNDNMLDWI